MRISKIRCDKCGTERDQPTVEIEGWTIAYGRNAQLSSLTKSLDLCQPCADVMYETIVQATTKKDWP